MQVHLNRCTPSEYLHTLAYIILGGYSFRARAAVSTGMMLLVRNATTGEYTASSRTRQSVHSAGTTMTSKGQWTSSSHVMLAMSISRFSSGLSPGDRGPARGLAWEPRFLPATEEGPPRALSTACGDSASKKLVTCHSSSCGVVRPDGSGDLQVIGQRITIGQNNCIVL